jgi:hypothetical protein
MLMMMMDCKCIVGIIAGHDSPKPAMADQVFVRLKAQNKAGEPQVRPPVTIRNDIPLYWEPH